jgi:GNAT superfamily N-acetyltransferase
MHIIDVKDKRTWRLFHKVPHLIYKNDPLWITPLESDIRKIFDPSKNKAFREGEARCMVLLNKKNKPIGRIAAFIDHGRNKKSDHIKGAIGFFECIHDKQAADILFEAAESYLVDKGVQIIDGPVNFGERDKFWGLLVKGRYEPIYTETYNPEYYIDFFEAADFKPYEKVLTLKGKTLDLPYKKFKESAEKSKEKYGLRVEFINTKNLRKYVDDFCEVYNVAFKDFPYYKPLTTKMVYNLFKKLKMVIDPKLACYVYKGDQPVGFCLLMPEINQFLKGAGGKVNIFTLSGILFRKFKPGKKIVKGIAVGIHPDFQGKGVIPILGDKLYKHASSHYSYFYLTTIRGLNKKMLNAMSHLDLKIDREHIAYRKILDSSIAFEDLNFEKVLGEKTED